MLLGRYLSHEHAWIRSRHTFFNSVALQLNFRVLYFAESLAVDLATGDIPQNLRPYTWCSTQMSHFLSGAFDKMNMVDAPGGFTVLRAMRNGTQYRAVSPNVHYTVESTLTGIRDFFTRLLTARGYPSVPANGHSFDDCVDAQIQLIQYIDGLPASERSDWTTWADTNFRTNCLGQGSQEYLARVLSPDPAGEIFDGFLNKIAFIDPDTKLPGLKDGPSPAPHSPHR